MSLIRCEHVTKLFHRGTITQMLVRNLRFGHKKESDWFWALQDVNLTLQGGGHRLGIIGTNGSGKTTLLRIIAGVTEPTTGTVVVHGRIVSLLELLAGMQQDFTGRENIYLHGLILGMRQHEIQKKLESIVEFAGVGEFLDMPLKHYSLGMTMRLGFSVAIHSHADILLVDEAWGVGDSEFQKKSVDTLRVLHEKGVTLIVVSHDPDVIAQLTENVLWLHQARVAGFGPSQQILNNYSKLVSTAS